MLFDDVLHLLKQHHPLAVVWKLEIEVHTVISEAAYVLLASQVLLVQLCELRSRELCEF